MTNGFDISVNRNILSGSNSLVVDILKQSFCSLLAEFLAANAKSTYSLLNAIIARQFYKYMLDIPSPKQIDWRIGPARNSSCGSISYPAYHFIESKYGDSRAEVVSLYNGSEALPLADLKFSDYEYLALHAVVGGGRLLVDSSTFTNEFALEWKKRSDVKFGKLISEFPPEFADVCVVYDAYASIFNSKNPFIKKFGVEAATLLNDDWESIYDRREELPGVAIAHFVLRSLRKGAGFWRALKDRKPETYRYFMSVLGVTEDRSIIAICTGQGVDDNGIIQLTPSRLGFDKEGFYRSSSPLKLPLGGEIPWPSGVEWQVRHSKSARPSKA